MIRVAADSLPAEILALIAKVEAGDTVVLERNGVAVARIEPSSPPAASSVAAGARSDRSESPLARQLRELRTGVTLGGLDWKALRDEGRR